MVNQLSLVPFDEVYSIVIPAQTSYYTLHIYYMDSKCKIDTYDTSRNR